MSASIEQLVELAGRLAKTGRWDEAENVWLEVRRKAPDHPEALFSLGVHALKRGDVDAAHALLTSAHRANPSDLLVLMTLCAAERHRGDPEGEHRTIEAALAIDPYFLPALLAKGSWLERFGSEAGAAATFANALKVAPPPAHWPDNLRRQLEHARDFVARRSKAFHAFLGNRLAAQTAELPASLAARWHEAASIMAGASKPYRSESNQLCVPRLPAIPFFERRDFPFLDALEANTGVIRDELLAALEQDREGFTPYIGYAPGQPVNQWHELNHSRRWSSFHLWRSGKPVEEHLRRCPQTASALAALPTADIDGLCPNAMFSVLAPRTVIPPHNGETNARVVAHLPLIVPDNCRFRVGFEEREWEVGRALIFDDTIEHEARNDSDEVRVVLIFDLWNPLLTPDERRMVNAMAAAARSFAAQEVVRSGLPP